MDEYRNQVEFEKYFQSLRKFCTPAEFDKLLKELDDPEQVHGFIQTLKRYQERDARWLWVGSIIRQTLTILMATGGLILLLRDVIPYVVSLAK